eukprot:CAMPEP_0114559850 /NCGR_PEP_ID=MMETSP0114-20121206/11140_1 /TAXON_ID=31324 /ORGANISM="Goniomonas sp, Strain m" /LENGTH=204 /DNA_ID=CAMNT_0001745345 /DNA_START=12 /DNA_END=626 /DNA_ORIENTATION=-
MAAAGADGDGPEMTPGYQAPKQVGISDLMKQDAEDESLRRYKEQLLGAAAQGANVSPADDPRRVVLQEFRIIFEDKPGNDTVYQLSNAADLQKLKTTPFILKEKCNYKIQITFRVQHEIVSGLKYLNTVYKKGIRVGKEELMIGSYGPQAEPHVVTFPRRDWEQAPSGMLARGSGTAKSKFVDDDGQTHLEFEYCFDLKKDWKD